MIWRVEVTGAGEVAAEGKHAPVIAIPNGGYTMTKRADGRYELSDERASHLLVAPKGMGPDGYIAQKIRDRSLRIVDGEWPRP